MRNNKILFKPNALIMATTTSKKLGMTSNEYKLFDTLLQKCQYNNNHGWRKAELNRNEIKKIINTGDSNYTSVKSIQDVFQKFKDIELRFKLGSKYVVGSAIGEYTYDEVTDIFSCSMSNNVFTILIEYNKHGYSPIDLQVVRKAKTYYTQKIYGMLRRWSKTNQTITYTYTLQEIKDVCDILDGTIYDQYKYFKRDILKKSTNEINEKLNMKVTFKEVKVMRKVQSIEFTFTDYEPRRYSFDEDRLIEPKEILANNEVAISIDEDIDSIEYMNLIDYKLNASIHTVFLKDFNDYKEYLKAVQTASQKTLGALGGKTINKRNYKYFKATLENLIPSKEII